MLGYIVAVCRVLNLGATDPRDNKLRFPFLFILLPCPLICERGEYNHHDVSTQLFTYNCIKCNGKISLKFGLCA